MKKIVLLSDGTGNSAAKRHKTNVWRLLPSARRASRRPDGGAKLTEAAPDVTALHMAAEHYAGAVAALLIARGADVSAARKENGWTPVVSHYIS